MNRNERQCIFPDDPGLRREKKRGIKEVMWKKKGVSNVDVFRSLF